MHACRFVGPAAVALLSCGCTWSRFDKVTDNPPVERFEAPTSTSSMGISIASYLGASGTSLVAAASDKVVLYDLGTGEAPSLTAISSQSCAGDNSCVLARGLASIKSQALTDNEGCVAYAMGTITESSGVPSGKLWLYCDGSKRRSLDLPPTIQNWLPNRNLTNDLSLHVATPHGMDAPALVAALPDASVAWFYGGSNAVPVELPMLPDGKKVGRALAVIPHGTRYTVAASSMTTDEVWLYEIDASAAASLTGCIQGPSQFGRLLATGRFDSDDTDDLLIADGTTVYSIAGTSLVSLVPSGTFSCTDLSSMQLIAKASCASVKDLNGCGAQPFASAIVAANLDGTGVEALVIGVQEATVRGESSAGAILVYKLNSGAFEVTDGLFVSSATSGDRLGTSVAAVPTGNVDRIAAGVPGDNSVMEFFCNSLVPAGSKAARCP